MENLVSVSLLSNNECPTRSQGMGPTGSQGMGLTGSQGMGPTGSQGMAIRPRSCQALSDPNLNFCFVCCIKVYWCNISFPAVISTTHISNGILHSSLYHGCFSCHIWISVLYCVVSLFWLHGVACLFWGPVLAVLFFFLKHPCCTVLALLCRLLFSGLFQMLWFCTSAPNVSCCPDKRD